MTTPSPELRPAAVLQQVVDALPKDVHGAVIIIGSLAAAYWLAERNASFSVRTKDVDSVLSPRAEAPRAGRAVAERLLSDGWAPRAGTKWSTPGNHETPDSDLPALRLVPPANHDWFLELLTEPDAAQASRGWTRFSLANGHHYGLPSFRFTSIATFDAAPTPFGIRAARLEMMALANMLENPTIRPDLIEGTTTKRSNKDLGRVLAIARSCTEDEIDSWAPAWQRALSDRFPADWRRLATTAGDGVRALVRSPEDLQQAMETVNNGLLAGAPVTVDQLKVTGERLLGSALNDLERLASDQRA